MDSSGLSALLGWLFLLVAVTIFVIIAVWLRKLSAEARAEGTETVQPPARRTGSRPWAWLGMATLLAAGFSVWLFYALTPAALPVVVKVTAYQFGWRFDYYQAGVFEGSGLETIHDSRRGSAETLRIRSLNISTKDRLDLPADTDVLFLVTSTDVIHRFWVPEFQVRRDIVPGAVTTVWARPQRVGGFVLRSDDICGAGDGTMVADLNIVGKPDFHNWLAQEVAARTITEAAE